MKTNTLAHLSDLHFGASDAHAAEAAALACTLRELAVDHVVVTGDVTHAGRLEELASFRAAFAPLLAEGRVSVVPGNHDRLGDDLGRNLMPGGRRVVATAHAGAYVVRVDSTGAHNRFLLAAHGELRPSDLDEVDAALAGAPDGHLVVVALHHHPVPLPEESFVERVSSSLGWPNAAELRLGAELLARVRGRCDLVLHGHRHRQRVADPRRQTPARRLQRRQLDEARPGPRLHARARPPRRDARLARRHDCVDGPRGAGVKA